MTADHPRLSRVGRHDRMITEWFQYKRKNGTGGAYQPVCCGWYTPLFTCEICRVLGSPHKVCDRCAFGWYGEYDDDVGGLYTLCVGCWNKIKPIIKMTDKINAFERLIRQVDKTRLAEGRK